MLSVLIPIYNVNVTCLVFELHDQLVGQLVRFEIILLDDASEEKNKEHNQLLKELDYVVYDELKENIGRSRIRNELVKRASYDYLLFLDCDSEVIDRDFCKKYLANCSENMVVCGGTAYTNVKPKDIKMNLHWKYGRKIEAIPTEIREKKPHQSFKSNNFLASKVVFDHVCFDEQITQYGHEDTLFGYFLKKMNIPVKHICNPALHSGLSAAENFLAKTEKALQNLSYIYYLYKNDLKLLTSIKLLNTYSKIKKNRMLWVIKILDKIFSKFLLRNLRGKKPRLFFFSMYKLFYFSRIN